jgi:hypothetical protein
MQITDFAEKNAVLRRYAAKHAGHLEVRQPTGSLGSESSWQIVVRFDGENHDFTLNGNEIAAASGDFQLAEQIPELFSNEKAA